MQKLRDRDLSPLSQVGGGGETARFVCGFMACDPHLSRPILNGLPPVFKVNVRTDRSGQWLESSILHLVEEAASGHMGSDADVGQAYPRLYSSTRCGDTSPVCRNTRRAGSRERVTQSLGKSLGLLHSARLTIRGQSRNRPVKSVCLCSALVERFTRYLAEPPMVYYLTRWRLQLAARSLARTPKGVAEIAAEVGYESESAFNRAFKREFGSPPAQYRREQKNGSAAELPIVMNLLSWRKHPLMLGILI